MNVLTLLALSDPVGHVIDKAYPESVIMLSMVSLVVGAILMLWLLLGAAKAIATGPEGQGVERYVAKTRIGQLVESIVVYLRDDMLLPVMGERMTRQWLGFLLGIFFFILILNLLGLIPFADIQEAIFMVTGWHPFHPVNLESESAVLFGGTATASISVTAGLATISFFAILYQALRELGIKGLLVHLCGGPELVSGSKALWLIVPLIFLVELAGMFIKPAALAIRLFANMVAGHLLLAVLMGFGLMAVPIGGWAVGAISVVSGIAAIAISFLELFVAVLQAFIFMFLTAVFISLMAHEEHEEHEEHGAHEGHDAHGDGHGKAGAHAAELAPAH
ncbi:MAG: F0F1 ATP synthase subunit A [Planctomycetota bacterium]|nr:F0F1 ATP synthase subunit A [Planctomycetota bacterium]MDA1105910.1 F0F1 ATP synthase subunit A [Planctomycetota bacterium]